MAARCGVWVVGERRVEELGGGEWYTCGTSMCDVASEVCEICRDEMRRVKWACLVRCLRVCVCGREWCM